MPDGAYLPDLPREQWPHVFLQAAGSAEAMTIEWRRVDDDGEERLYIIGRGGSRDGDPGTPIDVDENALLVYPDEVFEAAEAGDIFVAYLHTERVPGNYALRPLTLDDQRGTTA